MGLSPPGLRALLPGGAVQLPHQLATAPVPFQLLGERRRHLFRPPAGGEARHGLDHDARDQQQRKGRVVALSGSRRIRSGEAEGEVDQEEDVRQDQVGAYAAVERAYVPTAL